MFTKVIISALLSLPFQPANVAIIAPAQPGMFVQLPDTWVCPVGVTSVFVECYGSPGWSQGYDATPADGAGGAAYAASQIMVVPSKRYGIGRGGVRRVPGIGFYDNNAKLLVFAASGQNCIRGTFLDVSVSGNSLGGQASDCIGTVTYSGGNGGKTIGQPGTWSGGEGGWPATSTGNGANGANGIVGKRVGNGGYYAINPLFGQIGQRQLIWQDQLAPSIGQGAGGTIGAAFNAEYGYCRISW